MKRTACLGGKGSVSLKLLLRGRAPDERGGGKEVPHISLPMLALTREKLGGVYVFAKELS